jgi:hypothetical protein
MDTTTRFWLSAAVIGATFRFGIWGLLGALAIVAPVALVVSWWRKKHDEDWP